MRNLEDSMKKRNVSLILLCSFALAMTGCNKEENAGNGEVAVVEQVPKEVDETGFGITLEEQRLCAEYAAGVLMKYNAGSNMRVLEGKKLVQMDAIEQAQKAQQERREQLASEYQANKKQNNKKEDKTSGDKSANGSSSSVSTVNYINDMSVAAGTDAFSINYDGYEVTSSYSGTEGDFFAVEAVKGKVLLVTKFAVTNISGQTENLNMYSNQGKYRLNVNGEYYKAQQTLLLNDLSMYKDDIESGATVETVLVFEIPEDKVSNIGLMELNITIGDEVNTMLLQGGTAVVNVEETVEEENNSELAEEYEAALLAEEEAMENSQETESNETEESSGGNVTVVGSNNSITHE